MRQTRTYSVLVQSLLLSVVALGSGCTAVQGVREYFAYNDTSNDFVLTWRNGAWASQSWQMHKHNFTDQPFFSTFAEGFKAGYADVASGANGCTPALPPRKYWSWKYQTPEGQAKVAAWFSGYPHGARAAEEECAGLYSDIQVSESLRSEYRLGHEAPFKSPLYFHNPANWCPPQGQIPQGEPLEGEGMPQPGDKPLTTSTSMAPSIPAIPVGHSVEQRDAGDLHAQSGELSRLPSVQSTGNPYAPFGSITR